jgi:hypothetical protein
MAFFNEWLKKSNVNINVNVNVNSNVLFHVNVFYYAINNINAHFYFPFN